MKLYEWFEKIRDAYRRFDRSDEARLLLIFLCCIFIGSAIMLLDSIKNLIILDKTLGEVEQTLYAPLIGLKFSLAQLWDVAILIMAFNFGVALITALHLGKRLGKKES